MYGILERGYDTGLAKKHLKLIDEALKKANALLILMEPTDIEMSSHEHGKNLTPYFALMQNAYKQSTVTMLTCNYDTIQDIVKIVKEKYN